jgi:hypothetical protein
MKRYRVQFSVEVDNDLTDKQVAEWLIFWLRDKHILTPDNLIGAELHVIPNTLRASRPGPLIEKRVDSQFDGC